MECHIDGGVYFLAIAGVSALLYTMYTMTDTLINNQLTEKIERLEQLVLESYKEPSTDTEHTE